MVVIDKGYYDYDYSDYGKEEERPIVTVEETIKSESELRDALALFGWGRKSQGTQESQSHDAKELQELVIKDINERANGPKK